MDPTPTSLNPRILFQAASLPVVLLNRSINQPYSCSLISPSINHSLLRFIHPSFHPPIHLSFHLDYPPNQSTKLYITAFFCLAGISTLTPSVDSQTRQPLGLYFRSPNEQWCTCNIPYKPYNSIITTTK